MPPKEQTPVGPYNILCGRDKDAFHNSGNQRFRKIVLDWVPRYVAAPKRFEKSLAVQAVVEEVKADGGRFLKKQNTPDGPIFVQLSMKQTINKVGHSLRDMAAVHAKKKNNKTGEGTKTHSLQSVEAKKAPHKDQAAAQTNNAKSKISKLAFQQYHFGAPGSEGPVDKAVWKRSEKFDIAEPHCSSFLSCMHDKDQEISSAQMSNNQCITFPPRHTTTLLHQSELSITSEEWRHSEADLFSTSSWGPLAQDFFKRLE